MRSRHSCPEHTEICIATACHPDCVVTRRGDGVHQRTRVEPGTIWLCTVGTLEEDIRISEWHDILHIYLPPQRFSDISDVTGTRLSTQFVRYLGGIYDEVIRKAGLELLSEMRAPSAAGHVLAEHRPSTHGAPGSQAFSSDAHQHRQAAFQVAPR